MIRQFLLVFDHEHDRLIEEIDFGSDTTKAVEAYASKEREYRSNNRVEIVLMGSDSIETVRLTHGNYFDGSGTASKYFDLAGLR